MADYFLGLDYGTGGAKTTIINTKGEVLSYAYEEYEILTPHPGWSEHDPVNYWEAAGRIIRQAVKEAGIDPAEIRGIAVSSALPSLVLVDREGNPVQNAYNLMDKRAVEEVSWLKSHMVKKEYLIFQGTGWKTIPLLLTCFGKRETGLKISKKFIRLLPSMVLSI